MPDDRKLLAVIVKKDKSPLQIIEEDTRGDRLVHVIRVETGRVLLVEISLVHRFVCGSSMMTEDVDVS